MIQMTRMTMNDMNDQMASVARNLRKLSDARIRHKALTKKVEFSVVSKS
jgi:hypothetical protein